MGPGIKLKRRFEPETFLATELTSAPPCGDIISAYLIFNKLPEDLQDHLFIHSMLYQLGRTQKETLKHLLGIKGTKWRMKIGFKNKYRMCFNNLISMSSSLNRGNISWFAFVPGSNNMASKK